MKEKLVEISLNVTEIFFSGVPLSLGNCFTAFLCPMAGICRSALLFFMEIMYKTFGLGTFILGSYGVTLWCDQRPSSFPEKGRGRQSHNQGNDRGDQEAEGGTKSTEKILGEYLDDAT